MAAALRQSPGSAVLVGSDIPALTQAILERALRSVRRYAAVFGPADDGGYYLVGLRTPAHVFRLFDRVRWSGPHALADTLANAPRHWQIGFLPMLHDVDTGTDLGAGFNRRRAHS